MCEESSHALVLEPGEQRGLRDLLHDVVAHRPEDVTVALERRGLTNPLIATVESPNAGEASFLITAGVYAPLREYPPDETR